jgi:hypothetical protein
LWDALTEQAHKDRVMDKTLTVKDVMDTWILQPGFPVVNVTRNYEEDTLIVSQVHFCLHTYCYDLLKLYVTESVFNNYLKFKIILKRIILFVVSNIAIVMNY